MRADQIEHEARGWVGPEMEDAPGTDHSFRQRGSPPAEPGLVDRLVAEPAPGRVAHLVRMALDGAPRPFRPPFPAGGARRMMLQQQGGGEAAERRLHHPGVRDQLLEPVGHRVQLATRHQIGLVEHDEIARQQLRHRSAAGARIVGLGADGFGIGDDDDAVEPVARQIAIGRDVRRSRLTAHLHQNPFDLSDVRSHLGECVVGGAFAAAADTAVGQGDGVVGPRPHPGRAAADAVEIVHQDGDPLRRAVMEEMLEQGGLPGAVIAGDHGQGNDSAAGRRVGGKGRCCGCACHRSSASSVKSNSTNFASVGGWGQTLANTHFGTGSVKRASRGWYFPKNRDGSRDSHG